MIKKRMPLERLGPIGIRKTGRIASQTEMQDPKRPQDDNETTRLATGCSAALENARPKAGDTKRDQHQNPDSQQNQEKNSDSDQNRREKSSKQQQQQNKDDQQQSDDKQQQKGGQGKPVKLGAREVRRTARARIPVALSRARTCQRRGIEQGLSSERGFGKGANRRPRRRVSPQNRARNRAGKAASKKVPAQGKMASHHHPARKNNLKAESPVCLHWNARIGRQEEWRFIGQGGS